MGSSRAWIPGALETRGAPTWSARSGLPRSSIVVFASVLLSCGDGGPLVPRPEDVLSVRLESAHGVYHHAPGDHIDVEAQEAYYEWLFEQFDVQPAEPLVFFKYRDRAHMKEVTGEDTNGWAEIGNFRFHSIWEWDNHESVHALVTALWGHPPALINEGLAMAHQTLPILGRLEPQWNGTHVDTLAARFLRQDRIPPLETLLKSVDFFQYDTETTYPMAGSFVRSVLARHGYDPMEAFVASSDFHGGAAEFRTDFLAAFGEEIDDAWAVWLSELGR